MSKFKKAIRRSVKTRTGTIRYVDSGWSRQGWAVIADAMSRYQRPEGGSEPELLLGPEPMDMRMESYFNG